MASLLESIPVELLHVVLLEAGAIASLRLARTSKYFWRHIIINPSRDLSFAWLCLQSFHANNQRKHNQITPSTNHDEEDTLPNRLFGNALSEDSFFCERRLFQSYSAERL